MWIICQSVLTKVLKYVETFDQPNWTYFVQNSSDKITYNFTTSKHNCTKGLRIRKTTHFLPITYKLKALKRSPKTVKYCLYAKPRCIKKLPPCYMLTEYSGPIQNHSPKYRLDDSNNAMLISINPTILLYGHYTVKSVFSNWTHFLPPLCKHF